MASADKLSEAHEVVLEIFTMQRHVCALSWLHKSSALDLRVPKSETQTINHLLLLTVTTSFNVDSCHPP